MRLILVLGVVAFVLAASACESDEGGEGPVEDASEIPSTGDVELGTIAADAVAAHDVPAVAVARVELDEVRIGVAGTRSHVDSTALTSDSRFHLGSDTKAMTAVLVAQLVESGAIDLDSRATDVLQGVEVDPSLDGLTIREVLGHRTGLADDLDMRALYAATDPVAARRDVVYAALREPGGEPGSYAYANVNYMLAGVLVEEVSGSPWTDVIEERIFTPLGMTTCGFGAPTGALDPLGHTADGMAVRQDAPVADNPAAMGPAGTVHCSIGDWAKFVSAVLEVLTGTDSEILRAETASGLFAGTEPYVAGWRRSESGGDVTYGHDGSNTLWHARAVVRPGHRDAALIAVNTGEDDGVAQWTSSPVCFWASELVVRVRCSLLLPPTSRDSAPDQEPTPGEDKGEKRCSRERSPQEDADAHRNDEGCSAGCEVSLGARVHGSECGIRGIARQSGLMPPLVVSGPWSGSDAT